MSAHDWLRTYMWNGLEVPIKRFISLEECLLWKQFKIPPFDTEFESYALIPDSEPSELHSHMVELCHQLWTGKIIARGFKCLFSMAENAKQSERNHHGMAYPRQPVFEDIRYFSHLDKNTAMTKIPNQYWAFDLINWDTSELYSDFHNNLYAGDVFSGYQFIQIDFSDLLAVYPENEAISIAPNQNRKQELNARSNRENALHTELKALFEEWERPATNKECWNKLKSMDFLERDTVIQEVVTKQGNREARITWLSPHGKERRMELATFNNFMSKLRK